MSPEGKSNLSKEFTTEDSKIDDTKQIPLGDKSCMIVYSDPKHVPYINEVLSRTELLLSEFGFIPKRLGKEILSGEDYLKTVLDMITKCDIAVIILDGLRPNVIFEFGILRAHNKAIIITKSQNAKIAIKSYYSDYKDSGLQSKYFKEKLKEPSININHHISDFAGKHVPSFDIDDNDPESDKCLEKILKKEIKIKGEKLKNDVLITVTNKTDNKSKDILQDFISIIEYDIGIRDFSCDYVKQLDNKIVSNSEQNNTELPFLVYKYLGFSFLKCANANIKTVSEYVIFLSLAIDRYKKGLSISNQTFDKFEISNFNYFLGLCYRDLSQFEHREENLELAIKFFEEASINYKEDNLIFEHSIVLNNLGMVNQDLFHFTKDKNYLIRAQKCYTESLIFFNQKSYRLHYGILNFNLGNVLYSKSLLEVKDTWMFENICNDALAVYREAIANSFGNTLMLASSHLNAGTIFYNLQLIIGPSKNQDNFWVSAVNEFKHVLEILDSDKDNLTFGKANFNLGVIYNYLYIVKVKKEYRTASISYFESALQNYEINNIRKSIIETLNYLGSLYLPLQDIPTKNYDISDCNYALKALDKALVLTKAEDKNEQITIYYDIGITYEAIFLLDLDDKDIARRKAIEKYQKVLDKYEESSTIHIDFIDKIYQSSKDSIKKLEKQTP